jgi:hypothetical protein
MYSECYILADSTLRRGLYESAYMLVYERVSDVSPSPVVPANLASAIEAENATLQSLRRLYNVQKQLVELTVYFQMQHRSSTGYVDAAADPDALETAVVDDTNKKCTLHLLSSATLREALLQATGEFRRTPAGDLFECSDADLGSCVRLRRYNASNNRLGETFGGRDSATLQELGLAPAATLLLERRNATSDAPFVEFNPREMQVRLSLWTEGASADKTSSGNSNSSVVVVVAGEEAATVGSLRQQAGVAWGLDAEAAKKRCVLIRNTDASVVELNDDSKQLKKDHGIYPGDEVIVDVLPADAAADAVSKALVELRNRKKSVQIFYNNPTDNDVAASSCPAYVSTVEVSLDSTLVEIKQKIAAALGLSTDSFHTKRNAAAPQLKDESKTLSELGFVDQSILHLTVTSDGLAFIGCLKWSCLVDLM